MTPGCCEIDGLPAPAKTAGRASSVGGGGPTYADWAGRIRCYSLRRGTGGDAGGGCAGSSTSPLDADGKLPMMAHDLRLCTR